MKRTFLTFDAFSVFWKLAGLEESDLASLEEILMNNPTKGPVIRGSGCIRKIRYHRPGMGKSGGIRVFYFDFEEEEYIVFMAVILKNQSENLTEERIKRYAASAEIVKEQIRELNRRKVKNKSIKSKGKGTRK